MLTECYYGVGVAFPRMIADNYLELDGAFSIPRAIWDSDGKRVVGYSVFDVAFDAIP